jgi:hypothetical protein
MESLNDTLEKLLQCPEEVYLVIDALDECPLPTTWEEIISFLDSLAHRRNIHILMTSRRELDIETSITHLTNKTIVPFETSEVDKDIRSHILNRIAQEPYRSQWSKDVGHEVVNRLMEHAGGIFRWADLQLEELRGKEREEDINQTLKLLPKDMEASHRRILEKIQTERYTRVAHAIFTWLAYAPAQLTLREAMEIPMFDDAKQGPARSVGNDDDAAVLVEPKHRFSDTKWFRRMLSGLIKISSRDEQSLQNLSRLNDSRRFDYITWELFPMVLVLFSFNSLVPIIFVYLDLKHPPVNGYVAIFFTVIVGLHLLAYMTFRADGSGQRRGSLGREGEEAEGDEKAEEDEEEEDDKDLYSDPWASLPHS